MSDYANDDPALAWALAESLQMSLAPAAGPAAGPAAAAAATGARAASGAPRASLEVFWHYEAGETAYSARISFVRDGTARTFTIRKYRNGPSCGDSLDDEWMDGNGTWEATSDEVRLTASGPFQESYMSSTYSAVNPTPKPATGEYPETFKLSDAAATGAGVPCTCYGQEAKLRAKESVDEVAAFFNA